MDVVKAHRHREEEGEEGVLATPAFPAIAIGAVAEVEVDMDGGGVSVPVLSPFVRSGMVAKGINLHEKWYTRRTTGNRGPGFKLWTVFSFEYVILMDVERRCFSSVPWTCP